jgi:hypothetical protein
MISIGISTGKMVLGNERGFVLGVSMLISAILLLGGVLALLTSNTEVLVVRNEGDLTREFYLAEGGAVDALENYNRGTTFWLTDDFLMAGPLTAGSQVTSYNPEGLATATVEARCIEETGTSIPSLGEAANHLPRLRHVGPPPPRSGFSMKYFEVRRYAVTATSSTGNTQVQIGAWKAFNKY